MNTPNETATIDAPACSSAPPPAAAALCTRSYGGLSWPLIVGALVYLYVLAFGERLLTDPDTYWHIAAGRWIIEHGAVFTTDPFSHTVAGKAWMAHEWLSEVIFGLAYDFSGWFGVVALTAVTFAATMAILTRFLLKYLEPIHALAFVGLALALALTHLLARPFALAMPILVLWVVKLLEARERDEAPSFWLLPLMTLWANMFGGFTVGIAFTFAFTAEAVLAGSTKQEKLRQARAWGIFALAAIASALVTPNGIDGFLVTANVFTGDTLIHFIGEWQSPNFHKIQPLEIWLLGGLGVALYRGIKLPLIRLLLLLGLIHLALWYARSGELLGLLAPLILAAPLAAQFRHGPTSRLDVPFQQLARRAKFGPSVVVIVTLGFISAIVAGNGPLEPRNNMSPVAAVEAARKGDLHGPVLNHYDFGGYLIHAGIPTFIDGRSEMFGKVFVQEYFGGFTSRDKLRDLLDKYRVEWTLLRPGTYEAQFMDDLQWQRFHEDHTAVIHVRKAALERR